jgi:hypothetical protein
MAKVLALNLITTLLRQFYQSKFLKYMRILPLHESSMECLTWTRVTYLRRPLRTLTSTFQRVTSLLRGECP